MGLVPNHELMRIISKSTLVFLMLRLTYTKNFYSVYKNWFSNFVLWEWRGQASLAQVHPGFKTSSKRLPYFVDPKNLYIFIS